ncbi:16S rRNA (guanine(966)-N(2))-methyltransferase RsmD [Apibacter muscae]|uniref:16S rRNA (guanine(966)-N(2))-methyltransferase RsmD n=1 Tax=Apibacter muscae TaxID=2509004 RepID=UPI0011AD4BE4|nr:16S rRNA (guanine(966)-N(2))-methyltransferase RsmD [Apibacter muscae]TWP23417.1 16S rRNA (guanine(966)-N(2))-methyltransferase RsmD [Apibacter muscae]
MIRIISGEFKGKRIHAPKSFDVRPTTDFAKEALFSILSNRYSFSNINILDLFAGIGSITLEFASRGCQNITSIDNNDKHIKFIQDTVNTLNINDRVHLIKHDVITFLSKKSNQSYDLIFADPPFNTDAELYNKIINLIFQNKFLKSQGEFILEHESRKDLSELPFFSDSRKYGNVRFSFFNNSKVL